jgi:hypothetical protein
MGSVQSCSQPVIFFPKLPLCFSRRQWNVYDPETGSNGTVELYRCARFPDRWDLEKELFRGPALDTTIWIDDGVYWFLVTLLAPRGFGTQLWLFSATTLTGEWTPHPGNPISTDVRNNRGAGAIFRYNGKLFQPSQDCSKYYGYSFTLNEIVVWDRYQYQEKRCVTINPLWAPGLVGTHTYSHVGQVEIIDGCKIECSFTLSLIIVFRRANFAQFVLVMLLHRQSRFLQRG